jgi:lysophospholipase L1-like esterase
MLPIFQRTVTNSSGDVLPGASVEVRRESDNALVQLYADRAGTVLLPNPTTADSDGFVQFFAASSNYKITATSGSGTVVWRYVDIGSSDVRLDLAAPTGAAMVGSDDGAGGSLWVTSQDAIDYFRAQSGASPISFQDGRAYFSRAMSTLNVAGGKKVTWIGDSITEQGKPGQGSGAGLGVGFTSFIESAFSNITYSNQGIGGHTTLDVISRMSTILATGADLYVVAIGINDARYNDSRGATSLAAYITNMTTIINAIKATGASVVVLSIWPSFWKDQFAALGRKRTDERISQWNAALRSNAALNWLVPYVDAHREIVRAIDMSNVTDLIPDGVHPDYSATAGKRLYATAVMRGQLDKAEFRSNFVTTGTEFYKLRVLNNGASLCEIRNLKVSPYHKEAFAFSADASVGISGLVGSYSGAYAGYKNKSGDYPFEFLLTADLLPTSITTVPKGIGKGVKSFELFRSTDPDAAADPRHPSWQLIQAEYTNTGNAFSVFPRKREGVFYRVDFLDSTGTDGPGGTTGVYVKVKQVWGGVEPIRYAYSNMLDNGATSERFDLYFSAAGGSASAYMANVANTYPLRLAFESPQQLPSITIASVGEAGRDIKNWKVYRSFDPAALADHSHASWVEVSTGTGDATAIIT